VDDKMDARKLGMIAFAVIAVIAAAAVIYWTIQGQQPQIVQKVDGGTGTNPKVQYMKAQQDKKDAAGTEKDPNSLGDK